MVVFSLLKEEEISLERIQQSNIIDRIRNHRAKSDTVFQRTWNIVAQRETLSNMEFVKFV